MNEVNSAGFWLPTKADTALKHERREQKNLVWLEFYGDIFPGAKEGDAQVDGQEEEVRGEGDQQLGQGVEDEEDQDGGRAREARSTGEKIGV